MKATLANITRISVLSLLMVLLANISFAQQGKNAELTSEERSERMAKYLANKLGLTADQTTKLQAAHFNLQKARQNAIKTSDRSTMKIAHAAYRAELNKILTPEQQAKLKAIQEERKARAMRDRNKLQDNKKAN
jgi:Spy/CpxP family protein refolding chaperone